MALIQRSCGYSLRPTLTIAEIGELIAIVKDIQPTCLVLVDNCYGEFTEDREPGMVSSLFSARQLALANLLICITGLNELLWSKKRSTELTQHSAPATDMEHR